MDAATFASSHAMDEQSVMVTLIHRSVSLVYNIRICTHVEVSVLNICSYNFQVWFLADGAGPGERKPEEVRARWCSWTGWRP